MKNLLKLSTSLFALCIFSQTSIAGPYVGAAMGVGMLESDVEQTTNKYDIDYDLTQSFLLALGYKLPLLPIRVEGEIGVHTSDYDEVKLNSVQQNLKDGSTDLTSFMINAYAGLPLGLASPYVGAGIGRANVETSSFNNTNTYILKGEESSYAYQAMLGVEFGIFAIPLAIGLEYRYFFTSDMDLSDTGVTTKTEMNYESHTLLAKARLEF